MNILFLADLPAAGFGDTSGGLATGLMGAFVGIMVAMIVVFMIVSIALYIYTSLAYSKIGSKVKLSSPGIAWMPGFGPLAVTFETSKMHWWPFLMITLGFSIGYPLMLAGIANWIMIILASIVLLGTFAVFSVMSIIWHWKTYEAVGRPGWWILVPAVAGLLGLIVMVTGTAVESAVLLPLLGMLIMFLGIIAHLVLIGIAAWGGSPNQV
jgi:hypothetical protein